MWRGGGVLMFAAQSQVEVLFRVKGQSEGVGGRSATPQSASERRAFFFKKTNKQTNELYRNATTFLIFGAVKAAAISVLLPW